MPPKINYIANENLEKEAPLLYMAHHFNHLSREFNIEKFRLRFQEVKNSNTLQHELLKLDELGQNILHITMKNKEMFEMCLNELSLEALPNFILQKTVPNQHNLLHSFVRFGRVEALNVLLEKNNPAVHEAISQALHQKNKFDESPLDILAKGCHDSRSLQYLKKYDENWSKFELEVECNHEIMKKMPLFEFYHQIQAPDAENFEHDHCQQNFTHEDQTEDTPPEQGLLNMQVVSLFIASMGITAVTVAIVAVCASALSLPTAAIIAGAGLAATIVGSIGFFGYSPRNNDAENNQELEMFQQTHFQ